MESSVRATAKKWEDALNLLIESIEESGVLVMRNGIVGNNTKRPLSVKEFRGFALCDNLAPLIFINAADSLAAQMFTVIHELVHVWLGLSGISNCEIGAASDNAVEKFCNLVAAETLVPENELRALWQNTTMAGDYVGRLTRHFKVSSLVMIIRLKDLKLIRIQTFESLYRDQENIFKKFKAKKSTGGDFYKSQLIKTSRKFSSALIESAIEGRTPYKEALGLLGLKSTEVLFEYARNLKFSV
jgi:Zn-dependent peptidase ImmA (M78 family)